MGGHSKNLLLQDKKKNLYLLSALPDTKVDLRQLSTRLGHGKSGLRFANEVRPRWDARRRQKGYARRDGLLLPAARADAGQPIRPTD